MAAQGTPYLAHANPSMVSRLLEQNYNLALGLGHLNSYKYVRTDPMTPVSKFDFAAITRECSLAPLALLGLPPTAPRNADIDATLFVRT